MMQIRVLGSGCANCRTLAENAREAAREAGIGATVEEVHDLATIAGMGILTTPALTIDGELVLAGHVATVPQLKELLAGKA
jgi:small redox-active disulfide protein 2